MARNGEEELPFGDIDNAAIMMKIKILILLWSFREVFKEKLNKLYRVNTNDELRQMDQRKRDDKECKVKLKMEDIIRPIIMHLIHYYRHNDDRPLITGPI